MFPKVRLKPLSMLLWMLAAAVFTLRGSEAGISVCNKSPKDQQGSEKSEGAKGFSVNLNGSPRLYRPHQTYTIKLRGWRNEQIVKFQDFLLVAEPAQGHEMLDANSLGTFQLKPGDAMTKFSHLCSHAIGATSSISKKDVEVYWIAPGRNSGCISFKAMVVERPGIWYMDDEELTYNVCEDSSALAEPQDVDPCCACDEAKYEIVFEGIWSRHTHPKMFPEDEWRTQFSTLIGASHSSNYSIWDYGDIASSALQVLGEKGITRPLEAQMKHYSHSIRSVIKAHGLQQRSNVEGQTFAVFRVDPVHHLLSVVSKMIPSPDFIVGLSKENLCLPNCSWVPYRVLDLYPWDIGTDAGIAYNDPPSPLRPKNNIKRITSNYPNDPNSPFFDESGAPIKPAARLHIVRQRTYKRSNCQGNNYPYPPGSSPPLNPSWIPNGGSGGFGGGGGHSGLVDFDSSSNMDSGSRDYYQEDSGDHSEDGHHYRGGGGGSHGDIPQENSVISNYEIPGSWNQENPVLNGIGSSNSPSSYHYGQKEDEYPRRGGNGIDLGNDYGSSDSCETTEWDEWSECSSSCDIGSRIRRREFLDRSAASQRNCPEKNFEKELCPDLPECTPVQYGGNFDLFESGNQRKRKWRDGGADDAMDVPDLYKSFDDLDSDRGHYQSGSWPSNPYLNEQEHSGLNSYEYPNEGRPGIDCSVTDYGPWSDCSVSCGIGTKTRNRRYNDPERSSSCSEELHEVTRCTSPTCYESPLPSRRRGQSPDQSHLPLECRLSEWSAWSPCSKSCGLGYKLRTRLYLLPFVPRRSCDVRLMEKDNCMGTGDNCSGYQDSFGTLESLAAVNEASLPSSDSQDWETDICSLPPEPGPCRGHYTRWYFNSHDNTCQKFVFFGCEGNKNNFASEESCLETCHTRSNKDWISSYDLMHNDQPVEAMDEPSSRNKSDCEETPWSNWSPCTASCEEVGWKTRTREVSNTLKFLLTCPDEDLLQRTRCEIPPISCLSSDHTEWYQGSWRRKRRSIPADGP